MQHHSWLHNHVIGRCHENNLLQCDAKCVNWYSPLTGSEPLRSRLAPDVCFFSLVVLIQWVAIALHEHEHSGRILVCG